MAGWAGGLLWEPVLMPQISGGFTPLLPVTWRMSVHVCAVVSTVIPVNNWKSSRSWQTFVVALLTVKEQVSEVEAGV